MLAAQYVRRWETAPEEAVLITPATTFFNEQPPVDYQFGSMPAAALVGAHRPALNTPLYLSRRLAARSPWTDADEVATQRDRLARLVLGLTRRCRKQIFMVYTEIGEQGYEQRGQLLMVVATTVEADAAGRGEISEEIRQK